MKIARREFPHLAAGVAALRIAKAQVIAGTYRSRCSHGDASIYRCLQRGRKMQNRSSFLFATLIGIGIVALAGGSGAQYGGVASSLKTGTRLITLGTRGGPGPMVGRAQASNILIVNGALYIVDAGDGVTRRLTRAGIAIRDIDNIFITHPHSDHTGGLGGLLSSEYDSNRTRPVNIYGPPGTDASVKPLVQFLAVSADIRISEGMRTVPPVKIIPVPARFTRTRMSRSRPSKTPISILHRGPRPTANTSHIRTASKRPTGSSCFPATPARVPLSRRLPKAPTSWLPR
jgi:metallo-beta-lactamase superfamily protein